MSADRLIPVNDIVLRIGDVEIKGFVGASDAEFCTVCDGDDEGPCPFGCAELARLGGRRIKDP